MKLTTIWPLRHMTLRERLRRTADLLDMTIAAHLPRRVAYWAYIQQGSKAMPPNQVVPDARFMDLLANMKGPRS